MNNVRLLLSEFVSIFLSLLALSVASNSFSFDFHTLLIIPFSLQRKKLLPAHI